MLFRKKQPKSCQYCTFGTSLQDGLILCSKCGIRQMDAPCRRFKYDPCKRIPPKCAVLDLSQYTKEDFTL